MKNSGFTLVELMITVAILITIAGIAIPLYSNYIHETRLGVARTNMESLRIYLEDWHIDNGDYKANDDTSTFDKSGLETYFGWTPDGDQGTYDYTVTASTTSFNVLVEWTGDSGNTWVFCENRMANCCDNGTSGATKTDCP